MKRKDLYIRYPSKKDGTYDFIKKMGGDPEEIARVADLALPDTKDKIRYIPWSNLCHFFELTAKELNDPYFGLKWALNIPQDLRNTGPTLYLGSIARNMRHLLNMLLAYLKVYTNGVTFSYEEDIELDTVTGIIAIHPLSPASHIVLLLSLKIIE